VYICPETYFNNNGSCGCGAAAAAATVDGSGAVVAAKQLEQ